MFLAEGKAEVMIVRLRTLYMGLQAEAMGMRLTRGASCLSRCKKEFGWKGNRDSITRQLVAEINKQIAALPTRKT